MVDPATTGSIAAAEYRSLRGLERAKERVKAPAWRRLTALWGLCVGVSACAPAPAGGAGAVVAPLPLPSPSEADVTLFLIGDAGAPAAPADSEPVLVALRAAAAAAHHPVIVFLGDNVYPRGLPDSEAAGRAEAERRLEAQLDVVRTTGARGIFVPGNHDWDREGRGGWEAVRRQDRFIAALPDAHSTLLPGGGCPGPAIVDFGQTVRLVALDTEWWLHNGVKPTDHSSGCRTGSEREVIDSLRAAVRSAAGRAVVAIAHHPLESGWPARRALRLAGPPVPPTGSEIVAVDSPAPHRLTVPDRARERHL